MVADYKTNDLSLRGTRPQADDYRPERMAEAMIEHDYPLQALLYSVALHRYLAVATPRLHPRVPPWGRGVPLLTGHGRSRSGHS